MTLQSAEDRARELYEETTAKLQDVYYKAYRHAAMTGGVVKVDYNEETHIITVKVVEREDLLA